VVLVGIFRPAILGAIFLQDESRRLLAASVTAALVGVMVRSSMEASLSMPAVAMAFGWVAGLSQSSGVD
jgi:EamA domain-containing membrane protein RarD